MKRIRRESCSICRIVCVRSKCVIAAGQRGGRPEHDLIGGRCEGLGSSSIQELGEGHAHGASAISILFVDAHAGFVPRRAQQFDPRVPQGPLRSDRAGLDWIDFP